MWIAILFLFKFFMKLFVNPSISHSQGKAYSAGMFASCWVTVFGQLFINPSVSSFDTPLRSILFR